jgi:hypothetical protein
MTPWLHGITDKGKQLFTATGFFDCVAVSE